MKRAMMILLAVLASASLAAAATYYVDGTDGTDDTDAGPPARGSAADDRAWATIDYAVGQMAAGTHTIMVAAGTYAEGTWLSFDSNENGKNITIRGETGTAADVVITGSSTSYPVRVLSSMTSGSITFRDVSIDSSVATYLVFIDATAQTVTFTDCELDNDTANGYGLYVTGGATTHVFFSGGAIESTRNVARLSNAGDVTFTAAALTWTHATDPAIGLTGDINSVQVLNCVAAGGSSGTNALIDKRGGSPLTAYAELVRIQGCTGTCGVLYGDIQAAANGSFIKRFEVLDNTMTLNASTSGLIFFGVETTTETPDPQTRQTNPQPYERIVVKGNTFTFSGAAATHCLFLGVGADNAIVEDNTLIQSPSTTTYHVVVKSDNPTIVGNRIYGADGALYIAGAPNAVVMRNTIISTTGPALIVNDNQDYTVAPAGTYGASRYPTITDNVFYSGSGLALSFDADDDEDSEDYCPVVDRNLYWSGGANVANIGGNTAATASGVSAVRSAWASHLNFSGRLDLNSTVANPLLVATDGSSFELTIGSPARRIGLFGIDLGAVENRAIGQGGVHWIGY